MSPAARAAPLTRRRRLHLALVLQAGESTADPSAGPPSEPALAGGTGRPTAAAVQELYQSLLASREHARRRLHMLDTVELRHRDLPLPALVQRARTGQLHQSGANLDEVPG